MDVGDRSLAVVRRRGDDEPAVRLERRADDLGSLGDLVGRDRRRPCTSRCRCRGPGARGCRRPACVTSLVDDAQDRGRDLRRTVAHQVVADAARGTRRRIGRMTRGDAGRRRRLAALGRASRSRHRRRGGPRPAPRRSASVASGSYANIVRTHASRACGRVGRHDATGMGLDDGGPRGALLVVVPRGRIERATIRQERVERAHDLRGLVEAAQEFLDVQAGGVLHRLPAAVDEDEAGAAVTESRCRARRHDRPEPVAGQDEPGLAERSRTPHLPRQRSHPRRGSRGRRRRPRSGRRTGRGREGPSRPGGGAPTGRRAGARRAPRAIAV